MSTPTPTGQPTPASFRRPASRAASQTASRAASRGRRTTVTPRRRARSRSSPGRLYRSPRRPRDTDRRPTTRRHRRRAFPRRSPAPPCPPPATRPRPRRPLPEPVRRPPAQPQPQPYGFPAPQPGFPAPQPGPGFPAPNQGFGPPSPVPSQNPHQNPHQNLGPNPFPNAKASFGAALHSEWTKIRSVRSTFWTLLVTMAITIGLGALFAFGAVQHISPGDRVDGDWPAHAMSGLFLGQLVIVVFGAMAITAEYSTGMIRTSLTSQPRRATLFWAKTLIVTLVSLAVGLICSFSSFVIASAIYSGHDIHMSLSDGDTLRAVYGGGLYLAVSALLAFGLGAVLRHTAGAITTAVGLLFVLWILVAFLPSSWRTDIAKWVPFNAGMQIITTQPTDDMLAPWTGFAVFAGYAVAAIVLGAIVMRNKDA
ncbi:ABC transporter permease [Catenulispora yoronensis]